MPAVAADPSVSNSHVMKMLSAMLRSSYDVRPCTCLAMVGCACRQAHQTCHRHFVIHMLGWPNVLWAQEPPWPTWQIMCCCSAARHLSRQHDDGHCRWPSWAMTMHNGR